MVIPLNSLLDRLLISTFKSFSEVFVLFHCLKHISLSSHIAQISVYFFLLDWSMVFPDLGKMAFFRRPPQRTLLWLLELYALAVLPVWAAWALMLG